MISSWIWFFFFNSNYFSYVRWLKRQRVEICQKPIYLGLTNPSQRGPTLPSSEQANSVLLPDIHQEAANAVQKLQSGLCSTVRKIPRDFSWSSTRRSLFSLGIKGRRQRIKNAWSFSHHKLAQPLYGIKARNIYLFSHTLGGSSTHTYPCKVLPGGNI